jgi:DNA-binding IclR family transcriptional regulator
VTPEAEEFIEQAVDTIHQLEILMLLRRSPDRRWRVDHIAAELGMTTATVESSVSGLYVNGVLAMDDVNPAAYRYEPRSVALHAGVESLAAAYETDPMPVLRAVLNKPPRSLRTFSDAFLLRRRND